MAPHASVDYRKLNEVTRKDAYPLPRIDATLDALTGTQWFSTLNLLSGYWQVELAEEHRQKTAFAPLKVCLNLKSCHSGCAMLQLRSSD